MSSLDPVGCKVLRYVTLRYARVEGLCGLYDGDANNDLRLHNGTVYHFAPHVHSWSFPADYCTEWRYDQPTTQCPNNVMLIKL